MVDRLRVILVDDHEIVRQGVRTMLEAHPDIVVVAEATSASTAVEVVRDHRPDVVVMDIRLDDSSGIEATRTVRTRFPDVRVLMLTSFPDEQALISSIQAGASGYVLKQIRRDELVSAVRSVGDGQHVVDKTVTGVLLEQIRLGAAREPSGADERLSRLSAQERRILALVAAGRTNREIGLHLNLAEKTARNYVSVILQKLGLSRRGEAAAFLARRGTR
ncbi:response regulator transcription factor [Frankia sp. Mgl5]|uniref:response regulator transcription factor n=1 Tax=Frankia sp. Mgl5 TaxID=2933793 RepID=UPI00200EF5F5|nr:response regulator transcription factor [Frankia sp. Mgl5]MCK9927951.1 response regulator transcription factor [Frankia sp. Mgl5]